MASNATEDAVDAASAVERGGDDGAGTGRVSRSTRIEIELRHVEARRGIGEYVAWSTPKRGTRTVLTPTSVDFVEVKGLADVRRAAVGHETIVEVVACDGARLSIRGACTSADMTALIHAFRGRP